MPLPLPLPMPEGHGQGQGQGHGQGHGRARARQWTGCLSLKLRDKNAGIPGHNRGRGEEKKTKKNFQKYFPLGSEITDFLKFLAIDSYLQLC